MGKPTAHRVPISPLKFHLIAILISPILLAEIGTGETPPATTLRFGARRELATLNPFVGTLSYDHNLRTLLYETLLLEDKNYEIRPYLAEAWEISRDGLTYTFNIKRGIKFHNQKELNAEDIRWSIEYAQDPKNFAYGGPQLRSITSVSSPAPNRLRVKLKEPLASLLSLMTTLQTFAIVPKDSLKTAEKPQVFPPGTGPYRFEQWKPGQGVVVSRFSDYWQKGVPRIERIELKYVPEDDARFAALRAGDLDLVERLPLQYVAKVDKGEIPGIKIDTGAQSSGLKAIVFNTQRPPFDNVKMRQMVAHAVDGREILKGTYWDVGSAVNQKMFPGSPWYFPVPERKRDLQTTRRLLKEAGYDPAQRVTISGTRNMAKELYVVQSQLREAGLEVDIKPMDQIDHLKIYTTGEFQAAITAAGISQDPDVNYFDDFHTEAPIEGKRHRNHSGYSNRRVDSLLEEGRKTLDPQKRYKIYREFFELIYNEVPVLYLLVSPNLYAYRTTLKGFEMRGEGRYFSGDTGIPFAWLER